ncbi:hypothetical protein FXO37_30469 [Capsicum annuum]|nr:hypothetical protein FXO37_30469 [Capsicum annuum]
MRNLKEKNIPSHMLANTYRISFKYHRNVFLFPQPTIYSWIIESFTTNNVPARFHDPAANAELEVQEKLSLLEWFANEYRRFGCSLEFVTNKSKEGSQFFRSFGGIGGLLRYQLDVRAFDELSDDGEVFEDSE